MNDRSLVLAMTQGLGANLTNDEKRAHLADLKREHLIDRVCIQEILPPEDSWYLRSRMSEFIFSKRRFIFRFRRDPRIRSIKYANATQRLIQKASPAQSIEGKSPSRGASSSLQQPAPRPREAILSFGSLGLAQDKAGGATPASSPNDGRVL